jgi:hypothetical protein
MAKWSRNRRGSPLPFGIQSIPDGTFVTHCAPTAQVLSRSGGHFFVGTIVALSGVKITSVFRISLASNVF